jgi:hypothetical protein
MSLNNAGLDALLNDGNEAVFWAALGSGSAEDNENSNERIQLTLGAPSGGVITVTNVPLAFTGTPAAAVTHVLLFNQESPIGDTFYGFEPLTGDAAYNAEGDYEVTAFTITATST